MTTDLTEQTETRAAHRPTELEAARPRRLIVQDKDYNYWTQHDPKNKNQASPGVRIITDYHRAAHALPPHKWNYRFTTIDREEAGFRIGCLPVHCFHWSDADEITDTIPVTLPSGSEATNTHVIARLSSLKLETSLGLKALEDTKTKQELLDQYIKNLTIEKVQEWPLLYGTKNSGTFYDTKYLNGESHHILVTFDGVDMCVYYDLPKDKNPKFNENYRSRQIKSLND